MKLWTILSSLGVFIFGSWCGVGLMCLLRINCPEPETLPADAAGPVCAKLARKGE